VRGIGRFYCACAGLGALGLTAATAAVVNGLRALRIGPHGHAAALLGGHVSYPTATWRAGLVLPLATLGLAALLAGGRLALRVVSQQRRLLDAMEVEGCLPGRADVSVLADGRPEAFCAGYLRPRIYLSRGALDALRPAELEAVLAHEEHHRAQRDPLRLAVAQVLARALFFMPAVRALAERYTSLVELAADDAAVAASGGSPAPLAAALLALTSDGPARGVGIDPERVEQLAGRATPLRLPRLAVAGGLATLAAIAAALPIPGAPVEVHASLAVPFLSSQPCVLVLAALPGLFAAAATALFRRVATRTRAPAARAPRAALSRAGTSAGRSG
jgi:hypothetical protein